MTRPGPRTARRRRRAAVLRALGFVVAVALGAVAVWLVVTSKTQKAIEIGVLTGLWGLLIGAYSLYGSRSNTRDQTPPAQPSTELDVRKIGEIERAAVAAARREFQAELAQMLQAAIQGPLRSTVEDSVRTSVQSTVHGTVQDAVVNTVRREVEAGVAQEVSVLRNEVAALRNELLEKVGGQLRLERIETTRLIGSDIEALQAELRQLRQIGGVEDHDRDDTATLRIHQRGRDLDIHEAEIVVERVDERAERQPQPPAPQPEPPPEQRSAPEPQQQPKPEPASELEPEPEPEPEPEATVAAAQVPAEQAPEQPQEQAPEAAPEQPPQHAPQQPPQQAPLTAERPAAQGAPGDPFAGLPRLSRFVDPGPPPTAVAEADTANGASGAHRRSDEGDGDGSGRSGRRRRDDDSANDTLAKILARERR